MTSNKDSVPDGGWIEWTGGECPIPLGSLIKVQLRADSREEAEFDAPSFAGEWRWEQLGGGSDIIAYRVIKS